MCFGGSAEKSPSDPTQFIRANPAFLSPPSFRLSVKTECDEILTPAVLGKWFILDPKSPALHAGIDTATLPNLSETIIRDLKKYILTDINGAARPPGGNPDLGAYQRTPGR
jgi:hypothetical protein